MDIQILAEITARTHRYDVYVDTIIISCKLRNCSIYIHKMEITENRSPTRMLAKSEVNGIHIYM
jgi:hypothetical protein